MQTLEALEAGEYDYTTRRRARKSEMSPLTPERRGVELTLVDGGLIFFLDRLTLPDCVVEDGSPHEDGRLVRLLDRTEVVAESLVDRCGAGLSEKAEESRSVGEAERKGEDGKGGRLTISMALSYKILSVKT